MRTRLALFITILFFITTVGALLLSPRLLLTRVGAQQPAVVFQSTWDTATGTSHEAVTDGGRWPDYWEFNRNTGVQLLSVVRDGVNGHHALRVEQRGSALAANLQLDDFIAPSHDYYLRYYMRNDDTSRAADHVVTVDTYQYPNLTFMRKAGSPTGWNIISSFYGCGYTYPIGHWGPAQKLSNGAWYRFEYFVHFVDAMHIRVHPRVYDAAGTLIMSEDDFRQSDFGSTVWNGRNTWTLSSYYAAGNAFCVQPQWTNDLGLGNNGQEGATATGLAWYFSAVEIRTDGWPGPDSIASPGHTSPGGGLSQAYPGDALSTIPASSSPSVRRTYTR